MELQIKELVDSIRKDGIDTARAEADSIIADAKTQAENIIAKANAEADSIKERNEKDIEILKENAKMTAEHAKRDALLSFKDSVKAEFETILNNNIKKVVSGDSLAGLIRAAIADEDPSNYEAEIAEVSDGIRSQLAEEVKNGLEIKVSPKVRYGFRLASKDGSGYFDCSNEEIARMLAPFFPEIDL